MAAEDTRSPIGVSERPSAPAIERSAPTINSVTGALDDLGCSMERLRVLFRETMGELHDLAITAPSLIREQPANFGRRLYDAWVILLVAGEKLEDVESVVVAITEKAHQERRAAAV